MHKCLPRFLLLAATTACSATAVMQAQSQMPFKTGLWESSVTSTMTGMQMTPEMQARIAQMPPDAQARIKASMGGGAPRTTVLRTCLSKEQFDKWNDSLGQSKDSQQQCTHTNVVQTAKERSLDISCTSPTSKSTGHVDLVFDNGERGHGTSHMVRTSTQGSQAMKPITTDVKVDMHYISGDCGALKPGEAEPVK